MTPPILILFPPSGQLSWGIWGNLPCRCLKTQQRLFYLEKEDRRVCHTAWAGRQELDNFFNQLFKTLVVNIKGHGWKSFWLPWCFLPALRGKGKADISLPKPSSLSPQTAEISGLPNSPLQKLHLNMWCFYPNMESVYKTFFSMIYRLSNMYVCMYKTSRFQSLISRVFLFFDLFSGLLMYKTITLSLHSLYPLKQSLLSSWKKDKTSSFIST